MILIPAIDIKDGQVVRLFQGDFGKQTDYDPYPLMAAKRWRDMGAKWLHLVDLDGAKNGVMGNKEHVIYIAQKVNVSVQVGGGIRDEQTVEDLIKAGVKRVVLGTKALEEGHKFLKKMLELYGEKICVSLDCSNGFVTRHGWVSITDIKAVDLVLELEAMGLQWMIYTDIARDGALTGPNFEQIENMLKTVKNIKLIASGGIATLEDVRKLAAMQGVAAAITGKAIYEGKLDFKEALGVIDAQ
jgi:phosphoribosylformimino-5-aminoimidazole carboxamide ribotide isomerase